METPEPLPLIARLEACATLWAAQNGASLARLGRTVLGDSSFFNRVGTQPQGTTTATLERFARFFADLEQWPDGAVPDEVRAFIHAVGIVPEEAQVRG